MVVALSFPQHLLKRLFLHNALTSTIGINHVCLLAKYHPMNQWSDFNETFTKSSSGRLILLMATTVNLPYPTQKKGCDSVIFPDIDLKHSW